MTGEEPKLNRETKLFYLIGSFVLLGVLLFFFYGLKGSPPPANIVEYNYFVFEEIGGFWESNIEINGKLYRGSFRFNPFQVEDVVVSGSFSGFKTEPIYITFDPEADSDEYKYLALAASELTLNIVRALNFTVEAACTKNVTDACANRTIITCADNASVIYLVPKAPTQVTLDGDCITLSGHELELLKSVDRVLFQWYKIMR
ncbi:MAG: hypothetical protein QW165_02610 [Candidatus Woesearchaeota archaeon]